MYNLAVFIGYKIYLVCYDMAEFVKTGHLPVERGISKRRWCIYLVWGLFAVFYLTYIGINFYWVH